MNKLKHKYDLSNDLENIITKLIETKDTIVDAALDVKGSAKEAFSQSVENLKDKSIDVQENIETYINKKPFKSVGIALFLGLLIGYFSRK